MVLFSSTHLSSYLSLLLLLPSSCLCSRQQPTNQHREWKQIHLKRRLVCLFLSLALKLTSEHNLALEKSPDACLPHAAACGKLARASCFREERLTYTKLATSQPAAAAAAASTAVFIDKRRLP